MKRWIQLFVVLLALSSLGGCIPSQPVVTDYEENFEALWRIINERYCFLEEKGVDWDEVHTKYAKMVKDSELDDLTFFDLMASMLNLLKDGHVNLIAPFNTSRYGIWEGRDPTEGLNIYARNKALGGGQLLISGGMSYGAYLFEPNSLRFGYIAYGSFSSSLGNIPLIFTFFESKDVDGIILDLRANGGGSLQNSDKLLTYFFKEKTLVGYTSHKVGPGRDQFSELKALYVEPNKSATWAEKPLIILQDKGCYSATNDFLYKINRAENVTTVGIKSGGGAGMPATQELPNGWRIRYSAVKSYDHTKKYVEEGIEPDVTISNEGYSDNPGAPDMILYRGILELNKRVNEHKEKSQDGEQS